ncbi:hypothetical protein [Aeromonas veronii]|uniref:hypothetical protein n=1 Tax=Aeromonas veronii TaxID=654 RepID=UPI00187E2D68|nr:hypothetical protein [Aeromonas veronii]MBE8735504.1 hypothetical protein [Aeromonas veronii]MBE8739393.1 hypothetical protein [Aeromonas veronii]MBE8744162.1 hypothetical protein [Aeromonas veronii]MBE8765433.1 hypothetical protein [Aeromonas veronii]MBE8841455.1 hypothetical protein [Aeromonas veronii]
MNIETAGLIITGESLMEEQFANAAIRHYEDANALAASGRFDGAGHLIGFAAECAVKHGVLSIRADLDSLHGHFPFLVDVAKRHLSQRFHHGLYTIIKKQDLMQGWEVHNRYSDNGTVSKVQFELWRSHACSLISAAKVRK